LLKSSDGGRSSAPGLTPLQAGGHRARLLILLLLLLFLLLLLTAVSRLSRIGSWSSLYSLDTDRTGTTVSIIECASCGDHMTATERMASNGNVCRAVPQQWLFSAGFITVTFSRHVTVFINVNSHPDRG
jgi:hypothetical protein